MRRRSGVSATPFAPQSRDDVSSVSPVRRRGCSDSEEHATERAAANAAAGRILGVIGGESRRPARLNTQSDVVAARSGSVSFSVRSTGAPWSRKEVEPQSSRDGFLRAAFFAPVFFFAVRRLTFWVLLTFVGLRVLGTSIALSTTSLSF